jgi:hypothetical protein
MVRKGRPAAVGVAVDVSAGKCYVVTPHHVSEVTNPRLRPVLMPLFSDCAKQSEKLAMQHAQTIREALAKQRRAREQALREEQDEKKPAGQSPGPSSVMGSSANLRVAAMPHVASKDTISDTASTVGPSPVGGESGSPRGGGGNDVVEAKHLVEERDRAAALAVQTRLRRDADRAFAMALVIAGKNDGAKSDVKLAMAKSLFADGRYIEAASAFAEADDITVTEVILKYVGAMHAHADPDVNIGLQSYVCKRIRRWVQQRASWTEYSPQIYCLSHFLVLLLVNRCNDLNALDRTARMNALRGDAGRMAVDDEAGRRRAQFVFGAMLHGFGGGGSGGAASNEPAPDGAGSPTGGEEGGGQWNDAAAGHGAIGGLTAAVSRERSRDMAALRKAAAVAADFGTDAARAALQEITTQLRRNVSHASAIAGDDLGATSPTTEEKLIATVTPDAHKEQEMRLGQIRNGIVTAEVSIAATLLELGDNLDFGRIQDRILATANPSLVTVICTFLQRFDDVMRYLVVQRDYRSATRLLLHYCTDSMWAPLWRRHFPTLFPHFPVTLIRRGLIPHGSAIGLTPLDFSSAFSSYDCVKHNEAVQATDDTDLMILGQSDSPHRQGQGEGFASAVPTVARDNVVVEYLRHHIDKEGDTTLAISDWLVSSMAQHAYRLDVELGYKEEAKEVESELIRFCAQSKFHSAVFALRECIRTERHRAAAHLYSTLGHHTDALRVALLISDVDLAKTVIGRVEEAPLRDNLWRHLARHVVTLHGGPKQALILLRETKHLALSDVLPYFTDEVMLVDFKDELLASVNQFQRSMQDTQKQATRRQELAASISVDISEQRWQLKSVRSTARCEVCRQPALSREFTFFGDCGHAFHESCFFSEVARIYALVEDTGDDHSRDDARYESCFLCSSKTVKVSLGEPIEAATTFDLHL